MSDTDPAVTSFANHLLYDWQSAMDRFFGSVMSKQAARGLTNKQVRQALSIGYGDDIVDAWDDWNEGDL